jgi:hypothetical protein
MVMHRDGRIGKVDAGALKGRKQALDGLALNVGWNMRPHSELKSHDERVLNNNGMIVARRVAFEAATPSSSGTPMRGVTYWSVIKAMPLQAT